MTMTTEPLELTGRCSRCGGPATRAWRNRFAVAGAPLELDDRHYEEHKTAVDKGEWDEVSY
jgi:hypothetical protein